jgi:hypothetical protein
MPPSYSLERMRQQTHALRHGPIDTSDALDCWPPTYGPIISCDGERLPQQRISTGWHSIKSGINILEKSDREGSPEVLT